MVGNVRGHHGDSGDHGHPGKIALFSYYKCQKTQVDFDDTIFQN